MDGLKIVRSHFFEEGGRGCGGGDSNSNWMVEFLGIWTGEEVQVHRGGFVSQYVSGRVPALKWVTPSWIRYRHISG